MQCYLTKTSSCSGAAAAERKLLRREYRLYQLKPAAVADGLAYISSEPHKWQKIGTAIGMSASDARTTLDQIVDRRNLIAHNADIDDASRHKLSVSKSDAEAVTSFIRLLVD